MTQEKKRPTKEKNDAVHEDVAKKVGDVATKAELDNDIDAILDEIDDVLETNAEEFVKSFIQKGGQ